MKKILSIILLSMLLIGCGSKGGNNNNLNDLVKVESVGIVSKKWGNGDAVDIVTTVKNNSDSVVSYIKLQINYLDSSGNIINSSSKISTTPIQPNAKQEILLPEKRDNIIKVSSEIIDLEFE